MNEEQENQGADLILGKFKDQEALEAAYVNLEKLAAKKAAPAPVAEAPVFNEEAEVLRLGINGHKIKETVTNWVNNNFSDSAKEAFAKTPKTAETLQFMDEIRQQQSEERSRVPMSTEQVPEGPMNFKQFKNEFAANVDKMEKDPILLEKTLRKMADARAKDPTAHAGMGLEGFRPVG